ncbi:glycosyltransferase [Mucilaginibacter ginkgonis]|uniref:Glycosyltransferase n=1 Tax=Mucilaginibacter ginkgonis TaxID=2682091 RepID=A0A6I4IP17_9SPHI|nr:glycosyltransferase [Mucilaginibacter ginkgonis]QQL50852.1 glycosyltransferase [Mucilaginibacter ginkgonis]
MKLLFVTNDISFYGASRSLKTLLNELSLSNPEIGIHVVVPKRLKSRNDFTSLSAWFGIPKEHIHEFALPFYNNYKGNRQSVFHIIFNFRYRIEKISFISFLKKQQFDAIHLNSLTLVDLASNDFNIVLHVREILQKLTDHAWLQKRISSVKKIIFIDKATKNAFESFQLPLSTVLNNPFSMVGVVNAHLNERYAPLKEAVGERLCIAAIGKLTEDKGAEFLIQTFADSELQNVVLLFIGGGAKGYVDALKAKAPSNVLFLEESSDINFIFLVADFVIRGEGYPCIGRTVYEALYSGLGVILPGSEEYYKNSMTDFNKFASGFHSYLPRDGQDLKKLLLKLCKQPDGNRELLSNTNEYVNTFLQFIS